MIAIVVILICMAYIATATYVYFRLVWFFKQGRSYDPEMAAAGLAVLLPLGLCVLFFYTFFGKELAKGLPPRHVRQKERKGRSQ